MEKLPAQLIEEFLSTPPSRVATWADFRNFYRHMFLSTPPSRVATIKKGGVSMEMLVSIHATLAGGDRGTPYQLELAGEFLSTPPSRVATQKEERAP